MDRRRSWTVRVLALTIAGVSLAGCAVYPARPYGYGPVADTATGHTPTRRRPGAGAAMATAMVGGMEAAGATAVGGARLRKEPHGRHGGR